jgi:prolyl oligopeptidase
MRAMTPGACIALLGFCWAAAASPARDPLAPLGDAPPRPNPAPVKPVTETLWGKQVTDNYRYMEALDPSTVVWIKAQGAYARSMLDAIPPRAALQAKIAAFTGSLGLTQGYVNYAGRAFYEERTPGSDNFDLVVRDKAGKRKIVDMAALRAAHGGTPYAINYFFVSPDGSKVAAGISESGSEAASVFVYDAETGKQIAGPLDRANPGFVTWSDDSKTLYVTRLKKPLPGEPDAELYRNTVLAAWDLKSEPVVILGSTAGRGPPLTPDDTPALAISPGAPMAIGASYNGVQNELALWLAPTSRVNDPHVMWTPFVTRADDVTAEDAVGDTIYLLSHKNAPTYQVLSVKAGQPLAAAKVLVPAVSNRVIESIHAASDALYVLARRGAYSLLLRSAHGAASMEAIALPFKGHVAEAFTDPRRRGITIKLQSFVVPPTTFGYDPDKKSFSDLKIGLAPPDFDSGRYETNDLEAKAEDGVMVPDTLVRPKNAKGPQIVVIQSYGAYGASELADFSQRSVSFLEAGGTFAWCHVRGGGEFGDAWRLAGKDANKFHSWRDLIACGEDLIARGVTSKDRLFIFGGSAGGVTLGRAFTERPDLFAGVIDVVPAANMLRSEAEPSGPLNVPEFGTIKTEQGFKNLYEMDTIQHLRFSQYPPVLITTGLNDPRTAPWEPAKFTAALQASGTTRPILLRVDTEAGHGIGSTKAQNDAMYADMWAFVFWRAGLPDWRPNFSKK